MLLSTERTSMASIAGLIEAARGGSREALGRLLDACRPYLLTVAHQVLDDDLRSKAGASDLVQDTFVQAQEHFERFRGGTEAELLGWLRQILVHHAANLSRHYLGTAKRQVALEVPLGEGLDRQLPTGSSVHSDPAGLVAQERDQSLARAQENLPEHYRQVIQWRNYEALSFEEIGKRLGRSPEAARKLWARALENLERSLRNPHDAG
jgi:RNA polymerase sigma-70 factor (ECF subfamily)